MALTAVLRVLVASSALVGFVGAHAGHDQQPIAEDADWATRHMAEEHHVSNFDAPSFFTLHDFDSTGYWTADDISRLYGLKDESSKDVPQERKDQVVAEVISMLDFDGNGQVERDEWKRFCAEGKQLPDFGLGPGHHGDDEYEYEIHHFEKYHDENTKEEDLIHPEDIAHFKKHDEEALADERQEVFDRMAIVDHNIPAKFRRST